MCFVHSGPSYLRTDAWPLLWNETLETIISKAGTTIEPLQKPKNHTILCCRNLRLYPCLPNPPDNTTIPTANRTGSHPSCVFSTVLTPVSCIYLHSYWHLYLHLQPGQRSGAQQLRLHSRKAAVQAIAWVARDYDFDQQKNCRPLNRATCHATDLRKWTGFACVCSSIGGYIKLASKQCLRI